MKEKKTHFGEEMKDTHLTRAQESSKYSGNLHLSYPFLTYRVTSSNGTAQIYQR